MAEVITGQWSTLINPTKLNKELFLTAKNLSVELMKRVVKVKFIYSEKATNFYEISTADLSHVSSNGQIYGGDFAKFCGLLRIYELY